MADQKRWWKMWCSCLLDDDLLALPPADRWLWAALGTYTKEHGERGKVSFSLKNPALAHVFGVAPEHLIDAIKRLPNVQIEVQNEEGKSDNGKITVTFRNWYYYQEDSTTKERVKRLRAKRREEEIRGDKEEITRIVTPVENFSNDKEPQEKPIAEITRELWAGFERCWAIYPRKWAKEAAMAAWAELNPSADMQDRIYDAIKRMARSEEWTKEGGKYVPRFDRWLRESRWTDEPMDKPQRSVADDLTPEQRERLRKRMAEVDRKRAEAGKVIHKGQVEQFKKLATGIGKPV